MGCAKRGWGVNEINKKQHAISNTPCKNARITRKGCLAGHVTSRNRRVSWEVAAWVVVAWIEATLA